MPELPEVETVARQLHRAIVGKVIQRVTISKAKSWLGDAEKISHVPITNVSRKSKILRIHFANQYNLLIHLKMSGQLIFVDGDKRVGGGHPTLDWVRELPSSHTRVQFSFVDKTNLFFNDQRIFGWIRVVADEELPEQYKDLAPDIIDPAVTNTYFFERIHHRSIPIKQLIMDNSLVAGVGNIYACDALNLAKILPNRPGSSLSQADANRLLAAMREVVHLGIELGGATAHGEYVDVAGLAGKYQDKMRVYGRAGLACPSCGSQIVKIKLAGRGTYFCPNCQV